MSRIRPSNSKKIKFRDPHVINSKEYKFSNSIDHNVKIFKEIFHNDESIIFRHFSNQQNPQVKCCIVFIAGMVDDEIINQGIIWPITRNSIIQTSETIIDELKNYSIIVHTVKETWNIEELVEAILSGETVLLIENCSEALIIDTQGGETRSIEEPEAEKVIRGPREGFTESLMTNQMLIRKKIKNPNLKFQSRTFGMQTKTKAFICFIEGIANEKIVEELNKRLDAIEIDGVLDTGYIEELIKDSPYSIFNTIGNTERPDVVAGKLLEGRIALVLDGTPIALTLPHIFIEFFQANEDYYENFYFASFNRLLRIVSFMITVSIPGAYLALITYHQELIPTNLLLSISAARQGIPFPSIVEILGLLIVFEILRETGTRMPNYIGQALSIVGALVLGQAAVEARFVSAPMVIIVAMSGITGLMIPKLQGTIIILRLAFLLIAAVLGLYAIIFGISLVLIYLFSIRSFGIQYMAYTSILDYEELQDVTIRVPWWHMKFRPKSMLVNNLQRQRDGGRKIDKK
ncbi:spore germination protein KA [Natronincola peptidivorans]|uniref:Spore germination protein KA n=1 Tax=Natronincola peptidivorans TaxID=426128 RepID=A0A1I0E6Z2_9FIRM|nr:spore germination protein [Natronincola peptidivorans]SET40723.1 spore germination protein KA [Natronincola peptidivorans]